MDTIFAQDREFCINYAEGGIASLTSSIKRYANKAKKLAEKFPNETKLYENKDGSVYLIFPCEWIKFPSPKKVISDENRQKASERLKNARKTREKNNEI